MHYTCTCACTHAGPNVPAHVLMGAYSVPWLYGFMGTSKELIIHVYMLSKNV
jgi:hypothetical protein